MPDNDRTVQSARNDLSVGSERAVLVGVLLGGEDRGENPLEELSELARSAGAVVVDQTIQRRRSMDPATCVGKGKVEEIRLRADAAGADVVIFDNDLSPSQIREIERLTKRKVIDRSELILDIFASRARTYEARLQVELAQLEYTSPRLRGLWTHLERIAGAGGGTGAGAVGGIGTRGPGERQIEIDRRIVGRRIAALKQKLDDVDQRRVREVRARREHFTVSLVGYTNAGKSTLMNALTGSSAYAEDRLFATLDTLTRRWSLGGGRHVLLSDTVGFIRDLPHHLVASFRATLEEAIHADLLVHVADASSPWLRHQIDVVAGVLDDLGVGGRPQLLVLNKIDAVADPADLAILRHEFEDAVQISARSGEGLDRLTAAVDAVLRGEQQPRRVSLPVTDGKAIDLLERYSEVRDRQYENGRVIFDVLVSPRVLDHVHTVSAELRELDAGEPAE